MLNWLKSKMTKAAANQCKYNIKLNARRVVLAANAAYANIQETNQLKDVDKINVVTCQNDLLADVQLGIANELRVNDIKQVITGAINDLEITEGAKIAIEHVLESING